MIIKACWEDASVGLDEKSVIKWTNITDILNAICRGRQKLGVSCFAETYIDGREFNIALLAGESEVHILPPAEILFQDYPKDKLKMLDNRSKCIEDSFEYEHNCRTLDIAPQDTALINDLGTLPRCWQLIWLARLCPRISGRPNENGTGSECQPVPVAGCRFCRRIEHADIPYHEAIGLMIYDALK